MDSYGEATYGTGTYGPSVENPLVLLSDVQVSHRAVTPIDLHDAPAVALDLSDRRATLID